MALPVLYLNTLTALRCLTYVHKVRRGRPESGEQEGMAHAEHGGGSGLQLLDAWPLLILREVLGEDPLVPSGQTKQNFSRNSETETSTPKIAEISAEPKFGAKKFGWKDLQDPTCSKKRQGQQCANRRARHPPQQGTNHCTNERTHQ